MQFYDFVQMANSEEQWECPSCHNLEYLDDQDRAKIALGYGMDVRLHCRPCGHEVTGDLVDLHETASYRFAED